MTKLIIVFLAISLMFVGISYAKIDPETLVSMWLFNENKGDEVEDFSGKDNVGTLMNKPKWIEGKFGKALEFDGSDDYVSVGDTDELSGGPEKKLTVVAWFKPGDVAGRYRGIVSKYLSAGDKDWGLLVNSGQLEFGYEAGGNDWESSTPLKGGTVNADTWHHGAFVLNGKEVTLYLDGAEIGTAELPSDTPDTTGNVEIGGVAYKPVYFKGIIDEVAIFNVALSQEDIEAIMSKGLEVATGALAVAPAGKLATTWANAKASEFNY